MHKRVLLAEESDTIRGVAESVLRQNGFEVISVMSGEKALEVMEFSRPDLIVVGGELEGKGHKPLYEYVQENPRVASIPMLVFADKDSAGLPLPQEIIISRPFDPGEFMDKVNAFAGQPAARQTAGASNPLSGADLHDEFLDAALGLDQIDVTDSEVMDKTQIASKQNKPRGAEKMVGFDHHYDNDSDASDSGRVESLLIRDENAEIGHRPAKNRPDRMASSGKLEILNDQYGLIDKEASSLEPEDRAHDYQWFIDEVRRENQSPSGQSPASRQTEQPDELSFSDPSSMVDPITPSTPPKKSAGKSAGDSHGVDEFIDEFKKEIEKIRSDEPESVTIGDDSSSSKGRSKPLNWQDSVEKMTPEQVQLFTRRFISELADKVAQLIAAKIDSEKLMQLIKREIIKPLEKNQ